MREVKVPIECGATITPEGIAFLLVIWVIAAAYMAKQAAMPDEKPPKTATFLLYLFLNKTDREVLPGDLQEEFAVSILPQFGHVRAWLWYWAQVFQTIAYRNPVCRWLLIGGSVAKVGEWITRKMIGG
jgi:hypothetical protein